MKFDKTGSRDTNRLERVQIGRCRCVSSTRRSVTDGRMIWYEAKPSVLYQAKSRTYQPQYHINNSLVVFGVLCKFNDIIKKSSKIGGQQR